MGRAFHCASWKMCQWQRRPQVAFSACLFQEVDSVSFFQLLLLSEFVVKEATRGKTMPTLQVFARTLPSILNEIKSTKGFEQRTSISRLMFQKFHSGCCRERRAIKRPARRLLSQSGQQMMMVAWTDVREVEVVRSGQIWNIYGDGVNRTCQQIEQRCERKRKGKNMPRYWA